MNNPHSAPSELARSIVIGLALVLSLLRISHCFGAKVGLKRPGDGYPGRIEPYLASAELKAQMSRFGMTAGWFRRDELPEAKNDGCKSGPTDEMPYLLYSPRRGNKPVPMVVYFGGSIMRMNMRADGLKRRFVKLRRSFVPEVAIFVDRPSPTGGMTPGARHGGRTQYGRGCFQRARLAASRLGASQTG